MMKSTAFSLALALSITSVLADQALVAVTMNNKFDVGDVSSFGCSSGFANVRAGTHFTNGEAKLSTTTVPQTPNIGGIPGTNPLSGDSPSCFTCWELSYGENVVHITAVDVSDDGPGVFTLSSSTFNQLISGGYASVFQNVAEFGGVIAEQISNDACRS